MFKNIFNFLLILLLLFVYSCQSPSTVVFEESNMRKGMNRKDMKKVLRFKLLAAHNPFKGKCFHEYYPLKKKEIISGNAQILTEIDYSDVEPVFYILENVTIPSHKTFGENECTNGNGKLETWVKGHYEALDYVSKN